MALGKIEGLNHVGVFVADIEKSKKFYTEILEFTVEHENSIAAEDGLIKVAFIKNGSLVIELVQFPKTEAKKDGAVDHIALNVKNIEAAAETLRARGIVFETEDIAHAPHFWSAGSKWILFRGPDNEHLELTEIL